MPPITRHNVLDDANVLLLTGAGYRLVGTLHKGTNWVICQRTGGQARSGAYYNNNWAWTLSDQNTWGWVNAVYAQGGDNNGAFGGVPACGGAHGNPPGTTTFPEPAPIDDPPVGPSRYVALGDSDSSGDGAGNYLPAAPGRPAKCRRSRDAYSQVLAKRLRDNVRHDATRDFWACSGEKVRQMESRQFGALGSDVAVVTVGIGGNDLDWTSVLKACMADAVLNRAGRGKGCNHIADDNFAERLPQIRTLLAATYRKIRAAAPQAKIIVVGYPAIFEDSYSSTFCASAGALTRGARSDLRKAVARFDGEIQSLVAGVGGLRFGRVREPSRVQPRQGLDQGPRDRRADDLPPQPLRADRACRRDRGSQQRRVSVARAEADGLPSRCSGARRRVRRASVRIAPVSVRSAVAAGVARVLAWG